VADRKGCKYSGLGDMKPALARYSAGGVKRAAPIRTANPLRGTTRSPTMRRASRVGRSKCARRAASPSWLSRGGRKKKESLPLFSSNGRAFRKKRKVKIFAYARWRRSVSTFANQVPANGTNPQWPTEPKHTCPSCLKGGRRAEEESGRREPKASQTERIPTQ